MPCLRRVAHKQNRQDLQTPHRGRMGIRRQSRYQDRLLLGRRLMRRFAATPTSPTAPGRRIANIASYDGCDDGYKVSSPVGRFAANSFGLHDMLGNVWEWTVLALRREAYSGGGADVPPLSEGGPRVVRGGSWYHYPRGVRTCDAPRSHSRTPAPTATASASPGVLNPFYFSFYPFRFSVTAIMWRHKGERHEG